MVLNPASRVRTQYFLNLPLSSIVVKQSVMKQVIAKYLTENVCVIVCMGGGGEGRGGGAGAVATSRICLLITNFRIRVHLLSNSPFVTNILW